MRTANITVKEHGNRDNRQFMMMLEILSPEIKTMDDLKKAVMDACTEYVGTESGKRTYSYNCGCFNWADFEMELPNYFCQKHGFKRIPSPHVEINATVDWDEHLVDDSELEREDEEDA